MNIRQLSVKVASNRFDQMHYMKRLATIVTKYAVLC